MRTSIQKRNNEDIGANEARDSGSILQLGMSKGSKGFVGHFPTEIIKQA